VNLPFHYGGDWHTGLADPRAAAEWLQKHEG
jgi:hypothetical protein